jgi:rod shape-determining protein MreC
VPRNRTARLAVLDRPVQRSAPPFPSRARSATKRRVVVGVLAVLSLALLSVYFRESDSGPLHGVQDVGATAIRPFQVGAERVARPFRDLYGWFDAMVGAKEENERLRAELAKAQQQAIVNQNAAQENRDLREALEYQDLPGLADYRPVNTRVVSQQSPQFSKRLVIAAGSDAGIRKHAPVLSAGALVGEVTEITPDTALVTLLTDESSAVTAYAIRTGATGILESGEGGSLALDNVPKNKDVTRGDLIATAGSGVDRLPSLFPRGIPIGTVTSASQTDTESFKRVQIVSMVDLSNVEVVTVLVRR